jgi:ribonuclease HI
MKLTIFTDGGSRGNPGPAAVGIVVLNEQGEIIKKYSEAIGEATNNEAEYQALILALKKTKQLFGKEKTREIELEIKMDSELVVNQINHQFKLTEKHIQELFITVWNLLIDYKKYKIVAIPREENQEADKLVNEALDSKQANLL